MAGLLEPAILAPVGREAEANTIAKGIQPQVANQHARIPPTDTQPDPVVAMPEFGFNSAVYRTTTVPTDR